MGPPMHERAPIPSAVERLAAVEAKRAAKDIRQAARGRWPAIVRVREREAKGAAGIEEVDATPQLTLERFVKIVRKRKASLVGDRQLVLDFLRVAGYHSLQGELPLEAQAAALFEARGKLLKQAQNLQTSLDAGADARTNRELSLHDREQLSKRKLDFTNEAEQLGRSITHFRSYLKEVVPGDQARKRELRQNPVEWFDLVRALSLNQWEQNVAALDLFGKNALEQAASLEIEDVLLRAGLAPVSSAIPADAAAAVGTATLAAEDASTMEPVIDEAAVWAAEAAEQQLAQDELPEEIEALSIETEPVAEAAESAEASMIVEDAALNAQDAEAQSLVSGEKDLPPTGQEPGTGPPNERGRENVKKAQDFVEKGIENEAQIEEEKSAARDEGVEVPPQSDKKPAGFWGIFRRK